SATFVTRGNARSEAIDFEHWRTTKFTGQYAYHYPERRLSLTNFKTNFASGSISGTADVENLPGPSRVILNLDFSGIDAAQLSRHYPWDPKYRIFSNASGTLQGWLEGRLKRFDFSGHADLRSHSVEISPGIIALPLDGSTDYALRPGEARVTNADMRFYSTAVKADGLIHEKMSDLKVSFDSSNLSDVFFLYPDAN